MKQEICEVPHKERVLVTLAQDCPEYTNEGENPSLCLFFLPMSYPSQSKSRNLSKFREIMKNVNIDVSSY